MLIMRDKYPVALAIPSPPSEASLYTPRATVSAAQPAPDYDALSDDALVRACLAYDQLAWNELVTRYGSLVYSVARRAGISTTDIDDVFQEVFTIVFQNLPSLRDQSRLLFWLITITRRESLRVLKRGLFQTDLDDTLDETMANGNTSSSEDVERWESQQLVTRALDRLDARSRELVEALFFDSSPPRYDELAARLGIPRGSIGPTRARLVKKLETILLSMGTEMPF